MNINYDYNVSNLKCHRAKVEDVHFDRHDIIIIVSVHGHADINKLYARMLKLSDRVIALSMPCCSHITHTVESEYHVISTSILEIPSVKRQLLIFDSKK
jgi:hypothetical protein